MMKKQTMKFFAYFAAVLMVISILPAGALAASDNAQVNAQTTGNGHNNDDNGDNGADDSEDDSDSVGIEQHDRDRDMLHADENATRNMTANKVMNKIHEVRESKDRYQSARSDFAAIKSKNPNLNTEEAINATREYLISTIDYMISTLDNEEYIAELEEERENVEAATTRDELADSAKEIKSIWNDARKESVTSAGTAIDSKINAVLKKSDALVIRLENEIATMKENGEDVEDLEAMLERYKELLANATQNREQARATYMNGNGSYGENVREANRYVAQAGEDIRDSNAILREMLQALKQQREGVAVLTGDGALEAEGNGTAVISGNVTIDLTVTDAKLVIKDMAGDAIITTSDANYSTSNVDSGNSDDNNRAFVYLNVTGDVTIEGSRLTVMIRGNDIDLSAEGTGTAVLSGTGTYTVGDGDTEEWAPRYIDDSSDDEDEFESDDSTEDEAEDEDEVSDDDSSEEEEEENEEEDETSDDDSSEEDEEEDDGNTSENVNETSV